MERHTMPTKADFYVGLIFYQLFFVALYHVVSSQTVQNAKDLRTYLFTTNSYDKKIRPSSDQSSVTNVAISLSLVSINGIDEVAETLKTTAFLTITWKDDLLTWTPSSYGNIQTALYPQLDVWKPDVTLMNSFNDYRELGVDTLTVEVSSTGTVTWIPFQVFISTCSINVYYFPFDTQTCSLTFVTWGYKKTDVYLSSSQTEVNLEDYEANPGWDIISSSVSSTEDADDSFIQFNLEMKRKPLYYVTSVILPVIMLSILNVSVFVLPCDSGEKASYAITVFLSFAVFLTIVSAALPQNSDSTPVISVYIILQTTQSTFITLIALLFIRLANYDQSTPVPKWLLKCLFFRSTRSNIAKVNPEENYQSKVNETDSTQGASDKEIDWKTAVHRLDLYMFILFSVIAMLTTLICLAVCGAGDQ